MPFYDYKHPETGEVFSVSRKIKDRKKPHVADDGVECPFIPFYMTPTKNPFGITISDGEVFEKYPKDVKRMNPKKIKFRDGHSEPYDPKKHRR